MTTNVPAEHEARVAFFNLNPGEVRHEFLLSVINLLVEDSQNAKQLGGVYSRIAGGNLAIHRNEAADYFLTELPFEWLWFVDSDIQFPDDTLKKLLAAADPETAPVVSGLYCNVSTTGGLIPMAYDYDGTFVPVDSQQLRDNELLWVDGVGAGCLLIHRRVLEALADHYGPPAPFFGNDIHNGIINGEDFSFCIRLRKLGLPILLVTTTDLTHIKSYGITKSMMYDFNDSNDQKDDSNAEG